VLSSILYILLDGVFVFIA